MFDGVIVALVTPFRDDGTIDVAALDDLVERLIAARVDGLVPCGTTGESATLTHDEHRQVISSVVRRARGRVKVIAGTGSNNTSEAVSLTRFAKEAGADGALVITPYYNRPSQEGLYRHFRAVAEAAPIPIVLYNVPSRTACHLEPETAARLQSIPNIVAVKEASGSLEAVSRLRSATRLAVLAGDDSLTLPSLALGAVGVVSVAANVAPEPCVEMVRRFRAGDSAGALEIHDRLFPLFRALFIETNPVPVKAALRLLGRGTGAVRLPLCGLSDANAARLATVVAECGLA
jgi:4-hydroxy-tetrahydrodipicolinate synthase